MKIRSKSVGRKAFMLSAAVAMASAGSALAVDTGWNQNAAGTYDYTDTANWVGGSVNGVFDSSLTLLGAQTLTFGADTTLDTGLSFLYDGTFNLTFKSDATADYTLTLGGDILVNTVSASRSVSLGSTSTNQKLNLDLGGVTRTFDVRAGAGTNQQRSMSIYNNISNGSLIFQGSGTFNFSAGSYVSTATLGTLTMRNANISLNQYSDVTVAGNLTIDGGGSLNGSGNHGGISILTLSATAARDHVVSADNLVRANNGVVLFRGTNLGADAVGTNNTSHIIFNTAPNLVGGGGAAGSTTISILPWALGGSTTSAVDTFVTYDANGIRPLDTSTEFATTITDGATTSNNVMLANGSALTLESNTTINSLMTASGGTTTTINGNGTLTITSGAVYFGVGNGPANLSVALNFGAQQGVIGFGAGKGTLLNSSIAGSGGVVFYQSKEYVAFGSGGTGLTIANNANNSTYTGDTYVIGRINAQDGLLPSGARTGDVYVNGIIEFNTISLNGLNGSGYLSKANSGNGLLTLGDNYADATFDGTLVNGGSLSITKIGTNTQGLTGTASTITGSININEGALRVTTLNNIATPDASSSLGRPTSVANGTIDLGNLLTTGTLVVAGTGETTDRVINLAGTTGGGAIDQSGTGLLKFTSDFTATGSGSKTLTLRGSTAGTGEIAGAIVDKSISLTTSLVKDGLGTWTLSGVNTYTGDTTVVAGRLIVSGSLASAPVTVDSGATLELDGSTSIGDDAGLVLMSGETVNGIVDLNFASDQFETVGLLTLGNITYQYGTFNATNHPDFFTGTGNVIATPEPGSICFLGLGAMGLMKRRRRRK